MDSATTTPLGSVDTVVACPNCGNRFEVGEALANHYRQEAQAEARHTSAALEEKVRADERRRLEESNGIELEDLRRRAEEAEVNLKEAREVELALRTRQRELEQREQAIPLEIAKGREALEEKVRADERRRLEESNGIELEDLRRRAEEAEVNLKEAREVELALRTRQRELEQREQAIPLEIAKGREALKAEVEREHSEDFETRARELEARNQRLAEQLQDALWRNRDGSPQEQGPIRQEIFAEALSELFPTDEITNIKRGKAGADVHESVHTPDGGVAGLLLWEYKSGTKWDAKWVTKLATDRAEAKADVGIIVTTASPPAGPGLHQIGDAWVVDPANALIAARLFRHLLVSLFVQASIGDGREDESGRVYDFVHSRGCVESLRNLMQASLNQQKELDAERSSLLGHWDRRQQTIDGSIEALARLVNGFEGAGATLPESLHVPLPAGGRAQLVPAHTAKALGLGKKRLPPGPNLPGLGEIKSIAMTCRACGQNFEAESRPGRRPVLCPKCKEARSNRAG